MQCLPANLNPRILRIGILALQDKEEVNAVRIFQDANGPSNCSAYMFDTPTKPNDTNKKRSMTVPVRFRDA